MKVKEANQAISQNQDGNADGAEVLKSMQKTFRESVKPTWAVWDKNIKVGTHGRKSKEPEPV